MAVHWHFVVLWEYAAHGRSVIYIISIMSAKADREVGGGGGALLKGSLALIQKTL